MKAAVNEKFGSPEVLEIKEIKKPLINDDEILIKTYCTSVNMLDYVYRSGFKTMFGLVRLSIGLRKPKKTVLGFDIAGEVVEVGKNISLFNVGDKVFGGSITGANAEFAKGSEKGLAKMASNISYEEAAGIPVVGLTALQSLRDSGKIQENQNVLIYGASSGTGIYTVQIAKYYGAKVTAVASGKNEEIIRSLGIFDFIDYNKEDFWSMDKKYDLIIDAVGKVHPSKWKKSLKEDGIYVNVGSPFMSMIRFMLGQFGNRFRRKKYRSLYTQFNRSDLEFLADLYEQGKLKTVIDKVFPLEEIKDAHYYYQKGRTVGKIIIKIIS